MDRAGMMNRVEAAPDRPPTISDVVRTTMQIITEASACAEGLLDRVRGSRPQAASELAKEPERRLISDVERLASAANYLREQVAELDRIL